MDEMKVSSNIKRHIELIMKVQELIMNINPKNEGAIADNESKNTGINLQTAPHSIMSLQWLLSLIQRSIHHYHQHWPQYQCFFLRLVIHQDK